jgi:hypothetical protein
MPRTRDTFPCPNCDGDVPRGALACPHCGADDETGWSEDTIYDDLDVPTGYAREVEPGEDHRRAGTKDAFWKIVAVIVLAMIIAMILWGVW